MPAVEEVAPREHVDTDELLDENVVRAFTAKAGRSGFGRVASAMRSAAPAGTLPVAPLLKEVKLDAGPCEPVGMQEPTRTQSILNPELASPRCHFKAEQRGGHARSGFPPRLLTRPMNRPRRLRVRVVPAAVFAGHCVSVKRPGEGRVGFGHPGREGR